MSLTTDSVDSNWAPRSGARFLYGLIGLALAFALVALVAYRDRVAAGATDDLCGHYLLWVRERDERVAADLELAPERRTSFCRYFGIAGSAVTPPGRADPGSPPPVELLTGTWPNDEYSAQRLEGIDPIPMIPLEPHYVEVGHESPFRQWYLEVPPGKHALIDTGAPDTVLALEELSGAIDTVLGRSYLHGRSLAKGRYQDVPLPKGNAWFRQVFATAEDVPGAIGVGAFSATERLCMDFEEQLLRFQCDLERPAARIDFVPAYGGGYLLPVEVRGLVAPTLGLIDTGTGISTILWSGCSISDRYTLTLADPRNDGRPTETPIAMIRPKLLVGGGRIVEQDAFVHCIRSWHERPLVLLGMSFLNRFSAIGFDHERREIAFYH